MSSNEVSIANSQEAQRRHRRTLRILRSCPGFAVALGILCVSCVLSYGVGVYLGEMGCAYQQATWYEARITQFLKEHESRFGQLEVGHSPEGYAYLLGNVATQADLDYLRGEMARLFGEEMAAKVVKDVEIDDGIPTDDRDDPMQQD